MVRPTPSSGLKVKGIRLSGKSEYLWTPDDVTCAWPRRLAEYWKRDPPKTSLESYRVCPRCVIVPMNNGNEPEGESLITEFESELFDGSMLLRMRHTEGTTKEPYSDNKGYFHGMNRRYQVVMRGRFKKSVDWTDCFAGLQLERPVTNMPPKYVVKGALKVISFFAPQLRAKFNGPRPHSLTPLGSTPQSLRVSEPGSGVPLEGTHVEPLETSETLVGKASTQSSSLSRARVRKRAVDKLVAQGLKQHESMLRTLPEKEYTMEFLQHLFQASDFTVQLGPLLGQLCLIDSLDGQPLQILSLHQEHSLTSSMTKEELTQVPQTPIWSFDVWYERLYERARQVDEHGSDAVVVESFSSMSYS